LSRTGEAPTSARRRPQKSCGGCDVVHRNALTCHCSAFNLLGILASRHQTRLGQEAACPPVTLPPSPSNHTPRGPFCPRKCGLLVTCKGLGVRCLPSRYCCRWCDDKTNCIAFQPQNFKASCRLLQSCTSPEVQYFHWVCVCTTYSRAASLHPQHNIQEANIGRQD